MISFENALEKVLQQGRDYGTETLPLKLCGGRVLAETILADRDFPPFDRATKDGIALRAEVLATGRRDFVIQGTAAAGTPVQVLRQPDQCLEVMTGAVVPLDTDTVIPYEALQIDKDIARVKEPLGRGKNIHVKGSDLPKGGLLIAKGTRIGPAEIGILATVGKSEVQVKKLPRIALVSTGNELVEVHEQPEPHQLRRSNTHSLYAALREAGIQPMLLHVPDDLDMIRQKLSYLVQEVDILMLSGGVSMGKYDHIPGILEELGVNQIFHKVAQRPGKPFWFGSLGEKGPLVFSFPGNPVSTFTCYYVYFRPWLLKFQGESPAPATVQLTETTSNTTDLSLLKGSTFRLEDGMAQVSLVESSGSGDLQSLCGIHGFVVLPPADAPYEIGSKVHFYPCKSPWS